MEKDHGNHRWSSLSACNAVADLQLLLREWDTHLRELSIAESDSAKIRERKSGV